MSKEGTTTKNRFSGIVDATRARAGEEEQAKPENKGKAKGKSSNPNFVQVSAYLRKDTHKDARKLLLDDEQGRDLSDLLEELLQQWVSSRV